MTGNVIINKITPPPANVIKKGYTYMGVTGTFEGWVPTATDLYYNGVNSAGFTGTGEFQNTRYLMTSTATLFSFGCKKSYDVRSYSKLTMTCTLYLNGDSEIYIRDSDYNKIAFSSPNYVGIPGTITLDISQLITIPADWALCVNDLRKRGTNTDMNYVTRIRFS